MIISSIIYKKLNSMKRTFLNGLFIATFLLAGISSCKKEPVIIKSSGVTLDQSTTIVRIGTPLKLTASIAPFDATDKTLTWTTLNAAVATQINQYKLFLNEMFDLPIETYLYYSRDNELVIFE